MLLTMTDQRAVYNRLAARTRLSLDCLDGVDAGLREVLVNDVCGRLGSQFSAGFRVYEMIAANFTFNQHKHCTFFKGPMAHIKRSDTVM